MRQTGASIKAMVTNGLAKVAVDVGLHDVRFNADLLKALATSAGACGSVRRSERWWGREG